jgi:hypothetical protein
MLALLVLVLYCRVLCCFVVKLPEARPPPIPTGWVGWHLHLDPLIASLTWWAPPHCSQRECVLALPSDSIASKAYGAVAGVGVQRALYYCTKPEETESPEPCRPPGVFP